MVLSCFSFFSAFAIDWSEKYDKYYVDQALKYFDTLDSFADRESKPNYSKYVIRWEWFPWLKLTGHRKWVMKLDYFLTWFPTQVIDRDCRAFDKPPQARCRVVFHYLSNDVKVPIYEEFTFNDFGQMTFIEAWTDEEFYLPFDPNKDFWGESDDVYRLSTKVPGLLKGPDGKIKFRNKELKKLSKTDADLYQFRKKLRRPILRWFGELFRWSFIKDQSIRRLNMNWLKERRIFASRYNKKEKSCWNDIRKRVKERKVEKYLSLYQLGALKFCEKISKEMGQK